jgi:beta-barrel assembly-enhancing protease
MSEPETPKPSVGFGNSNRRIATELGLVALVIFVLVAGVWVLVANLADLVADRLPLEADVALGESAFEQLAPSTQRCKNEAVVRYVEGLAEPLIRESGSKFAFRFAVVDNVEVNAFALPGGFVTVNRGLVESAKSGEEIAAVLAHELAHVTLRHGTRRVVRQLGSMALISILLGGTDVETLGYVAGSLVNVAYDRDQEAEADTEGQRLLMAAGVSPAAMADFFERLATDQASPPTLLSTHPDPGDRSERAKEAAVGYVATRTLQSPSGLLCNP